MRAVCSRKSAKTSALMPKRTCVRRDMPLPENLLQATEVRSERQISGREPLRSVRATLFPGCRYRRSEEHTSELQSLMRISYAVFCWKKKNQNPKTRSETRSYKS